MRSGADAQAPLGLTAEYLTFCIAPSLQRQEAGKRRLTAFQIHT